MYSVSIDKEKFTVQKEGNEYLVNGRLFEWEMERINDRTYHILNNHLSYTVELIHIDRKEKLITLKINHKTSTLKIKDRFDLLLEKLGMSLIHENHIPDIKAPMPGLILEIKVKVGDVIQKGDPVLVLEAMKMENIIKAAGEGVVKAIPVGIGESVEKNQVLVHF